MRLCLQMLISASLSSAICPENAHSDKFTDPSTGRTFCYIVLRYYDIMYLQKEVWHEDPKGYYLHYGIVDTYPDAVRVCSMIARTNDKYFQKASNNASNPSFKPAWIHVPGLDIEFRLPTPETEEHLKWLFWNLSNDLYHNYYATRAEAENRYPEADRAKLWVGIKKSKTSTAIQMPVKDKESVPHLNGRPGECGYILKGSPRWPGENSCGGGSRCDSSGLYWVDCGETSLEGVSSWSNDRHVGRHMVACEFDEPHDCVQELLPICAFSIGYNACVLAGVYKTVKAPHARFGVPCIPNATEPYTSFPCPEHLVEQYCKKDCELIWNETSPCYIEDEDDQRYECGPDDINGTVRISVVDMLPARYGGKGCPPERTEYISCVCSKGFSTGESSCASAFLALAILIATS